MREILFRGKKLDNGEWVEGYLYITHTGTHEIGSYNAETNIERLASNVIPSTVGQYTGLKDRNGKRIFEGDIVEGADYTAEDGGYGVVSFDDGAFEVSGNNCVGTFHENYWAREFEVIGNIYDNQEFLEWGDEG